MQCTDYTPLNDGWHSNTSEAGETFYNSTVTALAGLLKRTVFRKKVIFIAKFYNCRH